MELTDWRTLSDQGPALVPCLDFPGWRAAAGFADLADGVAADACFLHFRPSAGPLAVCVDRWVAEFTATGRPVRAVLGYCAGASLATRLADAIAATGPPPMVVLFDAVPITGDSMTSQFTSTLESSAQHLTADELADARDLSEQLVTKYPDDLPRIATTLTDRYNRLMGAVADRLSLPAFLLQELTDAFTTYLDYLLLAGEGGFDMRTTTPLFLTSADYEPPVEGARTIALDIDHDDLLRDPEVHELVANLLRGKHPW
ncbi:MAG TPA: hypothetical protein VFB06_13890 [Streptosporangiaceae bacterium]|nr:hypothetical protein [Streptosporangiaceae bacterium]